MGGRARWRTATSHCRTTSRLTSTWYWECTHSPSPSLAPLKSSPSPPTGPPPSSPSSPSSPSRFHPLQVPASTTYYGIMVPRDLAAFYGYPDHSQFSRPSHYTANTSIATAQFDQVGPGSSILYESINFTDIASQGWFADVPGIQTTPAVYGTNVQSSPQNEPSLDVQAVTANNPLANATHWEESAGSWIYSLCLHLEAQAVPPQVVSISWTTPESGANAPDKANSFNYSTYLDRTRDRAHQAGRHGRHRHCEQRRPGRQRQRQLQLRLQQWRRGHRAVCGMAGVVPACDVGGRDAADEPGRHVHGDRHQLVQPHLRHHPTGLHVRPQLAVHTVRLCLPH